MKKIICLLFFLFAGMATNASAETTATFYDKQQRPLAQLDLLTNHVDQKGQEYIGLQLHLAKGWNTYSNRANSGGLPPQLDTRGSENINIGAVLFPPDQVFYFQGIATHGYKNAVTLPIEITRRDRNKNSLLNLQATFLICDIICIPATFNLRQVIAPSDGNGTTNGTTNNPRIAKAIAQTINNTHADATTNASFAVFARYVLFALLGGLLLNILPCVLPALSLKLRVLQNNKTTSRAAIKKSIAITALGLFCFFILLGWGGYLLRVMGRQFFWGVYFQSIWFVALLLIIFAVVFLLSLRNFSFNLAIPILPSYLRTRLATITTRHRGLNDFLLGLVMALLSASCLAPFMAISLTFAFYQPNPIFIPLLVGVMGFGLALPWFLLSTMPQTYQWRLPIKYRGGLLWLFNILVSVSLFSMVLWLTWLLKSNIGNWALLFVSLILFALLFQPGKILAKNNIGLLVIIAMLFAPFVYHAARPPQKISHHLAWDNFTTGAVLNQQVITKSRPTLLVVTADWCLTCQVNRQGLLSSKKFAAWAQENNVRLVLADWTTPNQSIADFIAAEQRIGIPLTIFYNNDGVKKILPELLSLDDFYGLTP